jgi:chemotaxis signal transduction protein
VSEPLSFLRCRLTAGSVGLTQACVRGLEGVEQLQRIPRLPRVPQPSALAGWLLGSELEVPVYDLSVLLGLPPCCSEDESTVVLYGCAAATCGLLVAAACPTRPEATTLLARPRLLDRPDLGAWVGVIAVEGDLVPWLDPSRLHPDLASCGAPRGAAAPGAREPLPIPSAVSTPALLIFGAENELSFALSVSQAVEVVELGAAPAPLPGGPDFLLGLIEWRGRAVPLVDLGVLGIAWGGNPIESIGPSRALIARTFDPTDCIALAVSGEIEMRRLPLEGRLIEVPEGAALLGCAEIDGRVVLLPDLERIVALEQHGLSLKNQPLSEARRKNHAVDAAYL